MSIANTAQEIVGWTMVVLDVRVGVAAAWETAKTAFRAIEANAERERRQEKVIEEGRQRSAALLQQANAITGSHEERPRTAIAADTERQRGQEEIVASPRLRFVPHLVHSRERPRT